MPSPSRGRMSWSWDPAPDGPRDRQRMRGDDAKSNTDPKWIFNHEKIFKKRELKWIEPQKLGINQPNWGCPVATLCHVLSLVDQRMLEWSTSVDECFLGLVTRDRWWMWFQGLRGWRGHGFVIFFGGKKTNSTHSHQNSRLLNSLFSLRLRCLGVEQKVMTRKMNRFR